MRRALPVLLATIVGLILLASFHTSSPSATATAPRLGAPPATVAPSSVAAGAAPPPRSSSSTDTTVAPKHSRTIVGQTVDNRYGPVQVRIAVDGSNLTDVTALQLPGDRPHSARLSQEAGPVLRSEALQAQSARIDVVSGATFTSESYAQSLQSALDQAGLH
jgi:uncharacterized protein with FMN-binding domain